MNNESSQIAEINKTKNKEEGRLQLHSEVDSTYIKALANSVRRYREVTSYGKAIVSSLKYEDVIDTSFDAVMKLTTCDRIDISFFDNKREFHCHESSRDQSRKHIRVSKMLYDEYDVMSTHAHIKEKLKIKTKV